MATTIRVLTVDRDRDQSKDLLPTVAPADRLVDLEVDKLAEEVKRTAESITTILTPLQEPREGLTLDEVQIGLEISAEGGVSLVGSLKAGAKAALTLIFRGS